jgi:hypothetical protein
MTLLVVLDIHSTSTTVVRVGDEAKEKTYLKNNFNEIYKN